MGKLVGNESEKKQPLINVFAPDAVKKQAEERRKFAGTVPVTCRSGSGGTVMKADDVGWETVGKDTVMLGQVHIFEGTSIRF